MTVLKENWYEDAQKYLTQVDADVDGMLGGLGYLTQLDLSASRDFLSDCLRTPLITATTPATRTMSPMSPGDDDEITAVQSTKSSKRVMRLCDCGAGIGRISKGLLMDFGQVDLVEPISKFLDQARSDPELTRVGEFIEKGLEEFEPEVGRYDVIWCQWVLSHLTDDDLTLFISRCLESLESGNGVLVIKENVSRGEDYVLDEQDSSVTRSLKVWERIFEQAGAKIVKERWQRGFPKNLFPVRMWCLKIKKS